MCFNAETSIAAFIVGLLCCIYIFTRGVTNNIVYDKVLGIVLFFIVIMQLLEYFLWKNQDCGNVNQIVTIVLIIALYLQPVINYIVKYKYYPELRKYNKIPIIVVVFTIVTILMLKELIQNKEKLCSTKDKQSCRLAWGSIKYLATNNTLLLIIGAVLYFTLFYIPRLFIKEKLYQYRVFSHYIGIVSLFVALVVSVYYKGRGFYDIFGSLWCFLAVAIGLTGVIGI